MADHLSRREPAHWILLCTAALVVLALLSLNGYVRHIAGPASLLARAQRLGRNAVGV
jgi:hypothetical protein